MMYTVMLFLLVLCTFCVSVWIKGRHWRKHLSAPGVLSYPALPIIGNALQLFGNTEHMYHLIIDFSQRSNAKQRPFVIWMGPWPLVALNDVEDIKLVSNTFLDKPFFYRFSEGYIGNGLITAPGTLWKSNIKRLAGIFTNVSSLDSYIETFNGTAQSFVKELKKNAISSPIHIFHASDNVALRAILDVSLGQSQQNIDIDKYCKTANRTLETFIERGSKVLNIIDWIYKLTPTYRELRENLEYLNGIAAQEIAIRKEQRKSVGYGGAKNRNKTFMDQLLDLHEVDPSFTEQQMIRELNTVIVAGQGTLAITLAIAFITLGNNPHIEDKLHAEIKDVFGDSKRPVNKEDLRKLKYCEAIINECLRLYPAVPIVMRHIDEDLRLKTFTIPKGTTCGFNMWAVGHSKKTWGPDVEEFRPERWLEDNCPFEGSIPFSIGKRSCIGRKYAMMVMKIVLASCIRELTITSVSNSKLRIKLDVALKIIDGDLIQVAERN